MKLWKLAVAGMVAGGLAGCNSEATSPAVDASEIAIAADLSLLADSAGAARGLRPEHLLRLYHEALLTSGNAEALALDSASRILADSGRMAAQAGDREAARAYFEAAHETLFDAVVLVLPDAWETLHAALDTIIARINDRIGDRDMPRLEAVLALVTRLHDDAAAAAAVDEGHALVLDMRAFRVLRSLRHHMGRPGARGLPGDVGADRPDGPGGLFGPDGGFRPGR